MSKQALIDTLSEATGLTKVAAATGINALFDLIARELRENGAFALTKFGTFSRHDAAARPGRNPRTGEEITIPASTRVAFKASPALKEAATPKKPGRKKAA